MTAAEEALGLALVPGESFGWGHCAHHLIEEMRGLTKATVLSDRRAKSSFPGRLIHQCLGADLAPAFAARGEKNIAYTFFEAPLHPAARANAASYDLILGGSNWCRDRLRDANLGPAETLVQGIDPALFHPQAIQPAQNAFVIYSGGKFELRKAQDVVLAACRELFPTYPDMVLVANWGNHWPETMQTVEISRHVDYRHDPAKDFTAAIEALIDTEGLPRDRIVLADIVPHADLPKLYAQSHVGLFPNRCEGGTNLVLMEFMATGRPVIASTGTGQADVLDPQWSLPLERHCPLPLEPGNGMPRVEWAEPSLDEVIAQIEYAYHHRDEIEAIGARGAAAMRSFTWRDSARRLHELALSV